MDKTAQRIIKQIKEHLPNLGEKLSTHNWVKSDKWDGYYCTACTRTLTLYKDKKYDKKFTKVCFSPWLKGKNRVLSCTESIIDDIIR